MTENKDILLAALDSLKWQKETRVTPNFIIHNQLNTGYSKIVEKNSAAPVFQSEQNHSAQTSYFSKFAKVESRKTINLEQFPILPDKVDCLWVGHQDTKTLLYENFENFRVIFNAIENIDELTAMCNIRDLFYNMRQAILYKTKRIIPHFLLETYQPDYKDLINLQKLINFELKTLPLYTTEKQLLSFDDDQIKQDNQLANKSKDQVQLSSQQFRQRQVDTTHQSPPQTLKQQDGHRMNLHRLSNFPLASKELVQNLTQMSEDSSQSDSAILEDQNTSQQSRDFLRDSKQVNIKKMLAFQRRSTLMNQPLNLSLCLLSKKQKKRSKLNQSSNSSSTLAADNDSSQFSISAKPSKQRQTQLVNGKIVRVSPRIMGHSQSQTLAITPGGRIRKQNKRDGEGQIEYLHPDNHLFRQLTHTSIIVRTGFNIKKTLEAYQLNHEDLSQVSFKGNPIAILSKEQQLFRQSFIKQFQNEKVIFKQLLNPLELLGHNICTLSVYVFVENFETMKSYIFNNVKVRFRHQNYYRTEEDFKASGFGVGKTLYRHNIDALITLLEKRAASSLGSEEIQRVTFWNRLCFKVLSILFLMKSMTKAPGSFDKNGKNTNNHLSQFCQLFQFRFQIDMFGRPWLFKVQSENCKFQMKNNSFDLFKVHLLKETLRRIEFKIVKSVKQEQIRQKEQRMIEQAFDNTGVEDILSGHVNDYIYGRSSFFTSGVNINEMQKQMKRVLGTFSIADKQNILKVYKLYDKWRDSITSRTSHFVKENANQQFQQNLFDTNFNAASLAKRRKERKLYLQLQNDKEQYTNFFKDRYKPSSGVLLHNDKVFNDIEEKRKRNEQRAYFEFEQQLIEDIKVTLTCSDADEMEAFVNQIKRIGSVLIREGFRMLINEDHKNDLQNFVSSFEVLRKIDKHYPEWLDNSLKLLIIGVKDSLTFLCQCAAKLREVLKQENSQFKKALSKVLKKLGVTQLGNKTIEQPINEIIQKQNAKKMEKRASRIMDPESMKIMLKKSEVAVFIRDKINSFFVNETGYEKRKTLFFKELMENEKEKNEAISSIPFLKKSFGQNEMTIPYLFQSQNDIIKEESSDNSSEKSIALRREAQKNARLSQTSKSSSYDINKSNNSSDVSSNSDSLKTSIMSFTTRKIQHQMNQSQSKGKLGLLRRVGEKQKKVHRNKKRNNLESDKSIGKTTDQIKKEKEALMEQERIDSFYLNLGKVPHVITDVQKSGINLIQRHRDIQKEKKYQNSKTKVYHQNTEVCSENPQSQKQESKPTVTVSRLDSLKELDSIQQSKQSILPRVQSVQLSTLSEHMQIPLSHRNIPTKSILIKKGNTAQSQIKPENKQQIKQPKTNSLVQQQNEEESETANEITQKYMKFLSKNFNQNLPYMKQSNLNKQKRLLMHNSKQSNWFFGQQNQVDRTRNTRQIQRVHSVDNLISKQQNSQDTQKTTSSRVDQQRIQRRRGDTLSPTMANSLKVDFNIGLNSPQSVESKQTAIPHDRGLLSINLQRSNNQNGLSQKSIVKKFAHASSQGFNISGESRNKGLNIAGNNQTQNLSKLNIQRSVTNFFERNNKDQPFPKIMSKSLPKLDALKPNQNKSTAGNMLRRNSVASHLSTSAFVEHGQQNKIKVPLSETKNKQTTVLDRRLSIIKPQAKATQIIMDKVEMVRKDRQRRATIFAERQSIAAKNSENTMFADLIQQHALSNNKRANERTSKEDKQHSLTNSVITEELLSSFSSSSQMETSSFSSQEKSSQDSTEVATNNAHLSSQKPQILFTKLGVGQSDKDSSSQQTSDSELLEYVTNQNSDRPEQFANLLSTQIPPQVKLMLNDSENNQRDPDFIFTPLFPLQAHANSAVGQDGMLKIRSGGQGRTQEIDINVRDIHSLIQGDDNTLKQQYHIENTFLLLLRACDTHDFYSQIHAYQNTVKQNMRNSSTYKKEKDDKRMSQKEKQKKIVTSPNQIRQRKRVTIANAVQIDSQLLRQVTQRD